LEPAVEMPTARCTRNQEDNQAGDHRRAGQGRLLGPAWQNAYETEHPNCPQ